VSKEEKRFLMVERAEVSKGGPAPHGWRTLYGLERRFGVFRIVKFAVATGTGFLINEAIVVLGVVALYHTIRVPSFGESSLTILGLDALALGVGDTVAFLINERVTVNGLDEEGRRGRHKWSVRWGEYQLTSLLGNAMIVVVQLALLATISLSPVFGNVMGAVVSYPVTYAVSMHFVWGVRPFRE
jgi:putative flippase GtrA